MNLRPFLNLRFFRKPAIGHCFLSLINGWRYWTPNTYPYCGDRLYSNRTVSALMQRNATAKILINLNTCNECRDYLFEDIWSRENYSDQERTVKKTGNRTPPQNVYALYTGVELNIIIVGRNIFQADYGWLPPMMLYKEIQSAVVFNHVLLMYTENFAMCWRGKLNT